MERDANDLTSDLPDPTRVSENEFKKSQATRTRILEAAIECLATIGYHATSSNTVARYAGLTRAAMLYHFSNRLSLIEAVVYYVTRRRVEMQWERQADLPRDDTFEARSMESSWEQVQTREFYAFSELAMASRTDPELEAIFRAAMESFDRARKEMALKLAQEDVKSDPGFDLRRDIARFALEGLALQDGITFDREKRTSELMWFLKLLFDSEISGPMIGKSQQLAARERKRGKKARRKGKASK